MNAPARLRAALLLALALCGPARGVDYDGWLNIEMQHNLGCNGASFCPRGTIAVKSIRMGTSIIDQAPFTNNHIKELKVLADEDGFYTIKTIVTSSDNKETEFLSSMKAEAFIDSGLSDTINAWVMHTGSVMSLSFQVANSSNPVSETEAEHKLTSKFYLRHIDQAPVPDTASYIQKLEREREAREKGEFKDNRSFLAKYWMYIVPVALFLMVSGAANPEPAAATR